MKLSKKREMKNKKQKIIYYSDSLNDDFFSDDPIDNITINSDYKFIHRNIFFRFISFFIFYFIVCPLVWFYTRILLRIKFVNSKSIKKLKQKCFIYGNHTGYIDAFIPNLLSWPKRNLIVVNPAAVSIKGLKTLVELLGVIPVPQSNNGMKEFISAIKYYQGKKNITIYPEAHIWPYYTGVREYSNVSFSYPIKNNLPTIAFFTAFSKPKRFLSCFRKANMTVYVSDPFYPDLSLPKKEAQDKIRNQVYNFMKEMSENYSNYEVIKYVYKEKE